jgi:hypothetical protein
VYLGSATFHLLALLWTVAIETIGIALWARFAYPHPWRAIASCLAVNLVVHTLFWYSQPLFARYGLTALYSAEVLVVVIEGALYAHILARTGVTPWLLSALLNLASYLTGLWLWQYLLVVPAFVSLTYGLTPVTFCHLVVCCTQVQPS